MILGAIARVKSGLKVFPCREKKPLTRTGFKDATNNLEQIIAWWKQWPDAQIGAATGRANDFIALDVDGERGAAWVARQIFPPTREVQTSPGKKQFWFRLPEGATAKCSAGVLAPEVDVRGEGGYVIVPPSIHHETGKAYRFLNRLELAPAPEWMLQPAGGKNGNQPTASDTIPKGRRHSTLLKLAGGLRARGLSQAAILADLIIVNQQHCVPPLDHAEVEKLAAWAGTKPAGFRGQPFETSAEVQLEYFNQIPRQEVKWLWEKRIARGKLNLFVGNAGEGKSLISLDVTSRVTRGVDFPDGARAQQGDVLLLSCEDTAEDVLGPRLDAAGADSSHVARVKAVKVTLADGAEAETSFCLERDLKTLEERLTKNPGFKLIIIDPLTAYIPRQINSWRDSEVRAILQPLVEFAGRSDIAIIAILHLRKAEAEALLRISGSVAFAASARCILGFGRDPNEPARRLMVPIKNNLAPLGTGLSYDIIENSAHVPLIAWQEPLHVDADEVLGTSNREKRARSQRRTEAEAWLRELLSNGPLPAEQIREEAKKLRISWGTLHRAKQQLRIKPRKAGMDGGWLWELPPDEDTNEDAKKAPP